MGKKRITKKQLKEDAFVSTAFEAGHFVQENLTKIILGLAGVLAVIGITWLFINYREERADEASLALFQAEALYMSGQFAAAALDFEKVAEDFAGSLEAKKAFFFAGDSYFKSGNFDQALEHFQQARNEFSNDDPLMVNCLIGLAACHEQLDEFDKAIELYKQAVEISTFDFQKIEAMSDLSRVLVSAGKNAEAFQVMDRIITDYPDNVRTSEIIELRAELLAKSTSN